MLADMETFSGGSPQKDKNSTGSPRFGLSTDGAVLSKP